MDAAVVFRKTIEEQRGILTARINSPVLSPTSACRLVEHTIPSQYKQVNASGHSRGWDTQVGQPPEVLLTR